VDLIVLLVNRLDPPVLAIRCDRF